MVMDIRSLVPGHSKTGLDKANKSRDKQKVSDSSGSSGDADDSVSLTENASKISQLVAQMRSAPVLDPDRVSPVKEKVDQGNYEIEYEEVANKMLDFESSYYD